MRCIIKDTEKYCKEHLYAEKHMKERIRLER